MRRFVVIPMLLACVACATGCGVPSFLVTPVGGSSELEETQVQPGKGWAAEKVAIVEVEGMLTNAKSGGFLQATENPVSRFLQQMDKAERDPAVKAVVLRVNSPGGTVTASDTMYEIVRRFRERTGKPVVSSTQEVAASGGYYVALASDQIVVQPTTVIGSIGVIFETIQFSGALGKLGISSQAIKSGTLKDIGSPLKPLRDDERQVMQEMVDEYFGRFVVLVHQRRTKLTEAPVSDLKEYRKDGYSGVFSGRVFSGAKAVELGLADRTGLLADAIDVARTLSKSPQAKAVLYRRPYGYGGSIYANSEAPAPRANTLQLQLPDSVAPLPDGFYYLWRP